MPIELLAILAGAVLLLVLINVSQRRISPLDPKYYAKKWGDIKILSRTSAAGGRLAVIEADKLLDRALKDLRFAGETTADRLKTAKPSLGGVDAVWDAHRLRNRLVHEDVHPKPAKLRSALKAFESALKKLGAL
jgi:hypothetical protein